MEAAGANGTLPSADRFVIDCGIFIQRFQFHEDRAQTVVAAADGHVGLPDPVPVVKEGRTCAVRKGKGI